MHKFFFTAFLLFGLAAPPLWAQQPEPITFSDWEWDSEHFNLRLPKLPAKELKYKEGEPELFIELIPAEDLSSLRTLEGLFVDSIYAHKTFRINNKRYTGTIYGHNSQTTAAFMAHFMDGAIHGNFIIYKSNGLIITKLYRNGVLELITYDDSRVKH